MQQPFKPGDHVRIRVGNRQRLGLVESVDGPVVTVRVDFGDGRVRQYNRRDTLVEPAQES